MSSRFYATKIQLNSFPFHDLTPKTITAAKDIVSIFLLINLPRKTDLSLYLKTLFKRTTANCYYEEDCGII